MSQAGIINISDSTIPSDVPTTFTTQNGSAVPAAHILLVKAYDSIENNDNGIVTKGGIAAGDPPGTGATNELDIYLTNRTTGTATTTNAVTADVITFTPPLTKGIYKLIFEVNGWCDGDTLGATYELQGAIISNATNIANIGTPVRIMNGDTTEFNAELVDVVIDGTFTSAILRCTGIAGKIIRWTAVLNYRFGGA